MYRDHPGRRIVKIMYGVWSPSLTLPSLSVPLSFRRDLLRVAAKEPKHRDQLVSGKQNKKTKRQRAVREVSGRSRLARVGEPRILCMGMG
jgi:hypothetical protein